MEKELNNNEYLLFEYINRVAQREQDMQDIIDAKHFYKLYYQNQGLSAKLFKRALTDNEYLIFRFVIQLSQLKYTSPQLKRAIEFYKSYYEERLVKDVNERRKNAREKINGLLIMDDMLHYIVNHMNLLGRRKKSKKSKKSKKTKKRRMSRR